MAGVTPDDDGIETRLAAHGFRDVSDWSTYDKAQMTGRIPPNWEWFFFTAAYSEACLTIYPPDRYPFARPGSDPVSGWDPMALGDEPPAIWWHTWPTYACPTDVEMAETRILRLIELWRSGAPSGKN
jgi:hypothetical protein